MNIAFWSMSSGKSATSGNMLAVGVMSTLVYSVGGILVQFDKGSRTFDDVFGSKKQENLIMEEYAYYNAKGFDRLLDKEQIGKLDVYDIRDNLVPLKNTYLSYIPTSKRIKSGINDRNLAEKTENILRLVNDIGEYNFIDCASGNSEMSKMLLKMADVIVINIHQDCDVSKLSIGKELLKKAVFLVGMFDYDADTGVEEIRESLGITKDRISVIPYNTGFNDAIWQGKVIQYMTKYITTRRNSENFNFINDVFKATGMILRKAGYDERQKRVFK